MKKQGTEGVYFVGVREPIEVRKELLSCSKDVIGNLRAYEGFRQVREQKLETFAKLRKHVDGLALLMGRLRKALPETKLRAVARVEEQDLGVTIREERPQKGSSALDKLDKELAQLESKLSQLK